MRGDIAGTGGCGDLPDGLVQHPGQHESEDQRQKNRNPGPEATEGDGGHDGEDHHGECDARILRPVDAGDDGGQVEADQHDHRAADDRRQHLAERPAAHEMHQHPHQGQRHAGHQDGAGDVRRRAAAGPDCHDRADKRRRRTQIGRDLVGHHQQENDRADPRHHDRQIGIQSHDEREDEGRPEHGDDVLGSDADCLRPGQPLVRPDDFPDRQWLFVSDELPTDGHQTPPRAAT
jgi:hypothetical protein